jgi:hypothetical protein
MIRTISSAQTFFVKYILSFVLTVGTGLDILDMFIEKNNFQERAEFPSQLITPWVLLFAWAIGCIFIWWFCMRLKRIRINEKTIFISNYLKEIQVPLRDVINISEISLINIHPVFLTFQSSTEFGKKIVFMPKIRFTVDLKEMFSSHPVAGELREIVNRAIK